MGLAVWAFENEVEIGKIYEAHDKYTEQKAKVLIVRKATEEEFLNEKYEEPELTGIYYQISID